jgi:hypothetical protein
MAAKDSWVELTSNATNESVWVNMALVTRLEERDSVTVLTFVHESTIAVKENPSLALSRIGFVKK